MFTEHSEMQESEKESRPKVQIRGSSVWRAGETLTGSAVF